MGYEVYGGEEMQTALEQTMRERRFDVVHFDHLHTAQLLPVARRVSPQTHVVVDEHNVEGQVFERVAALALDDAAARPAPGEPCEEAREHARLGRGPGARLLRTRPRPAPRARGAAGPGRPQRRGHGGHGGGPFAQAGCGRLRWVHGLRWPNSDAALWLGRSIWPLARPRLPGTRLLLVGRNPPQAVQELAEDCLEVTGTVACVKPYLAAASAIPLRAGSGTRLDSRGRRGARPRRRHPAGR